MIGRAYMGEVLIQVWLRIQWVIGQTTECIKREFEKTSGVHASSRKSTKMKVEGKYDTHLKLFRWKEGVYKASAGEWCD